MEDKLGSKCVFCTVVLYFLLFQVGATDSESFLLVADRSLKAIYHVDVTSGANVSLPLGELPDPSGLDYDHVTDHVYWSDVSEGKIMRAYRNGTNLEVVAENGVISPTDVALDFAGGNVYWTDSRAYVIRVARMDGEYSRVIVREAELKAPQGIALDPENGYMYWTSYWNTGAKIERAAMDGSGNGTLVNTGLKWPQGIAIDMQGQRLYWCDGGFHRIMSSTLQGGDVIEVVSITGLSLGYFGIVVEDSYMYWTAWALDHITRTPKTSSGQIHTIGSGFRQMMDLHFHNGSAVEVISNACTASNGGCDHLCLARPGGRTCACDVNWDLQQDGTTCQLRDVPTPTGDFLLVADSQLDAIFQVNITSGAKVSLPLGHLVYPLAIDFDPATDYVYWSDGLLRKISRAHRNGSGGVEDIVTNDITSPNGLAVDFVGRNIYWTDSERDVISVAKLDGMYVKDLISEHLDQPHGLVLDAQNGYMYWADWGSEPKIEKAAMDGTERTTLVDTQLQQPTGLAIDFIEQRLYWCDWGQHRIESTDWTGGDRTLFIQHNLQTSLLGIALDDAYVYWSASNVQSIYRITKVHLPRETTVSEGFGQPKGIHLQRVPSVRSEMNVCTEENAGCQQLCLVRPGGRTCACQNGETLQRDGLSCRLSGATTTPPITTNQPSTSNLSLDIKVGISVAGFALFILIASGFAIFHFVKKKRQQREADRARDREYATANEAMEEEVYDVIRDEGFISVAAFPPPVPAPLKRAENSYLDMEQFAMKIPNGYEDPKTLKQATPTDSIAKHTQQPGYQHDDDMKHDEHGYLDLNGVRANLPPSGPTENDIDYDYTDPVKKPDPYQSLGGSYQQHHEYQGLRNKSPKAQSDDHDYTHPMRKTDPYQPLGGSYHRHNVYQGLSKKAKNQPAVGNAGQDYIQPNVVNIPEPDYNN
ncbi:low-density lipoprotein receptor-related protein 6-like [Branchiostoma floridae x Branchiostoma japonicum]